MTLDLEGSVTDHVPALFGRRQPQRRAVPERADHRDCAARQSLHPSARGMSVQGWTETCPSGRTGPARSPSTRPGDERRLAAGRRRCRWGGGGGGGGGGGAALLYRDRRSLPGSTTYPVACRGGGGGAGGGGGSAPTLATVGSSSPRRLCRQPTDATNPAGAGYPGARRRSAGHLPEPPDRHGHQSVGRRGRPRWSRRGDRGQRPRGERVDDGDHRPGRTGKVLSGHGAAASWLRTNATVGVTVVLSGGARRAAAPARCGPRCPGCLGTTVFSTTRTRAPPRSMRSRRCRRGPIDVVDAPRLGGCLAGPARTGGMPAHVGRGYNIRCRPLLVGHPISVSGASAWGPVRRPWWRPASPAYYRPGSR